MSEDEVHYFNNALRVERHRPEYHMTYSPAEERAAAYYALTGESAPYDLDAGRQVPEKHTDKPKSKPKKLQWKYVFEESTDEESEQASSSSRKIKDWVDVVSESSEQTFQTAEGRPTPDMLMNQVVRHDRDDQMRKQPASPVSSYPSRSTSRSTRTIPSKRDEHSREHELVKRTLFEERRETKFTSMIRTLSEKQATNPRIDNLRRHEAHERERKLLDQDSMSSQRSERSYERKPLGQHTMSSQKSCVRERPARSYAQDSEPQLVAVRGDIQHEHHHHHHHHVPEPQVDSAKGYGPYSFTEASSQLERTATATSGTTSITRNRRGDLQFESKLEPKRSKSTKSSKKSSSTVIAAKMIARSYGWNG